MDSDQSPLLMGLLPTTISSAKTYKKLASNNTQTILYYKMPEPSDCNPALTERILAALEDFIKSRDILSRKIRPRLLPWTFNDCVIRLI
jgi:hypothetical protein